MEKGIDVIHGASVLVVLQITSRALTFVANQYLLRFLTAELLGISAQLEVYYLLVVSLARESLRVAVQREGPAGTEGEKGTEEDHGAATQAVVNLGHVATMLGLVFGPVLGLLYRRSLDPTMAASMPGLVPSLYLYGVAAVVELAAEPGFVVLQTRLLVKERARAEAVATAVRCALTLGLASWAWRRRAVDLGPLPFAAGQLGYGLVLLAAYGGGGAALASREAAGWSMFPRRLKHGSFFHARALRLAAGLFAQGLVKQVLTQGDTFMAGVLSDARAQGVYSLANNYGGLAARLLFQPIEETCRNYFGRLLAAPEPTTQAVGQALSSLTAILRAYALLSLVVLSIGPSAAPLLVSLVAGPRWEGSGAGACLASYMGYVPLLALNGVAEAFVAAVATGPQLRVQSAYMMVFSAVFAAAGYVCLRVLAWGAVGLVVANGVNMACRIAWCGVFIKRHFDAAGTPFDLLAVLPGPVSVLTGVLASRATAYMAVDVETPSHPRHVLLALVRMAGMAVPFVAVLLASERRFLLGAYRTFKPKRD